MCQMPTFFFKEKSEREKTFYILQDFFSNLRCKRIKAWSRAVISCTQHEQRERENRRELNNESNAPQPYTFPIFHLKNWEDYFSFWRSFQANQGAETFGGGLRISLFSRHSDWCSDDLSSWTAPGECWEIAGLLRCIWMFVSVWGNIEAVQLLLDLMHFKDSSCFTLVKDVWFSQHYSLRLFMTALATQLQLATVQILVGRRNFAHTDETKFVKRLFAFCHAENNPASEFVQSWQK